MNARLLLSTALATALALSAAAAGGAESAADSTKKSKMRDLITARMIEDAKKSPAPSAAPTDKSAPAGGPAAATPTSPAPAPVQAGREPPTVLPKVEVRRNRITELDQKLAQQEKEIAREKVNTKATETDKALNSSVLAKPLAIFGGQSAQHRESLAKERVSLMESEKDLIEAIAHAKTKEKKQELQKQLEELKAFRRELEKSLR